MTQQIINVGTVANDGTGDTIRGAMVKTNANFTEVYDRADTVESNLNGLVVSSRVSGELAQFKSDGKLGSVSGLSVDQYGTIRYDRTSNSDSLQAFVITDTFNTILSLVEYSNSSENAPALALVKRRGTTSAPLPPVSGDILGTVSAIGAGNSAAGRILWNASSTTTPSVTDTVFEIQTQISGVLAARVRVDELGRLVLTSGIQFNDGSVQTGAAISIADLKTLVAASTDFADFQSRIAAL